MRPGVNLPQVILIGAALAAVAAVPLYLYYRRRIGLKRAGACLFMVLTLLGSMGAMIYAVQYWTHGGYTLYARHPHWENGNYVAETQPLILWACSVSILVLAGLPLVLKIYKAWVCGEMTDEERAPGSAGIRAWLSPVNLLLGIATAICAANVINDPIPAMLGLAAVVLMAYPAVNTLCRQGEIESPGEGPENLSVEREKVLGMLEAGKITAEESAELLNALRSSSEGLRASRAARPAIRGAMMIGAGLVVIGFFLPWFSVNLGQEMQRLSGALSGQLNQFGMGSIPQQMQQIPQMSDMMKNFDGTTVNISGGDVKYGIGWMILILSAGVALLPMFAQQLDDETRRKAEMIAVAAGAFLLIYLGATNWRYINVGFVLVLAGYILQGANMIKRLGGLHAVGGLMNKHA